MAIKIPTRGRIGRFARILEQETNKEVSEKVMQDADKYEKGNYAEKAAWWRGAIERLEKEVGKETAIKIMESCGRKCCGGTYRKLAEKYWKESESVEDFLDKLNNYVWHGQVVGIGGGGLKLKDERTIIGGYDRCYCGQVKQTKEPFPTDIYCRCSARWFKQFFESALGREVEVDILQSIITGADSCEFIIHI